MKPLEGRSIIVTGAAQGIGATFALALAEQGAQVAVCDVRSPEYTVARVRELGGIAWGDSCDVTDGPAVARFVARTEEVFGGVHGLVNNAALFATLPKRPLEEITSADFDRVMAVNVRGAFECAKAVAPVMRRQGYGKIVNIASGTVFKGQVQMLSYVTSKGAVVAMTRCLARELGPAGIRANCLAPGFTMSEGVAEQADWVKDGQATVAGRCLRRDQTPEDLTGALAFLLSAGSDFMTGQTVVVDGGSVMH
ncbi:SDR family NAD(P)-dependent oxidoreductase [Hydrogenophaga sp.]|uniref:SDR family NAD(P)-dependent oxidoreductase n=1 Tax=Hydrogenophaga sp. TaxID=1904254 RepID=UPI0027283103|nr:SDR family oxidoreductase [Hydrogenophaga sp.]MDO9437627.1 SDR family oxidoreductase [Hydrogenophaga sp.]